MSRGGAFMSVDPTAIFDLLVRQQTLSGGFTEGAGTMENPAGATPAKSGGNPGRAI